MPYRDLLLEVNYMLYLYYIQLRVLETSFARLTYISQDH